MGVELGVRVWDLGVLGEALAWVGHAFDIAPARRTAPRSRRVQPQPRRASLL